MRVVYLKNLDFVKGMQQKYIRYGKYQLFEMLSFRREVAERSHILKCEEVLVVMRKTNCVFATV
jgi:hypothetical protein